MNIPFSGFAADQSVSLLGDGPSSRPLGPSGDLGTSQRTYAPEAITAKLRKRNDLSSQNWPLSEAVHVVGETPLAVNGTAILPYDCGADQLPERAAIIEPDLNAHLADRVGDLHTTQQAVWEEFKALLEGQTGEVEALRRLGEAAHEQAEKADRLLALITRCSAPVHLINVTEEIFDALRDTEEQITEALKWEKGMGRRLRALQKHSAARRSGQVASTKVVDFLV